MTVYWRGVFPAVATQFDRDGTLDLDGMARHIEAIVGLGFETRPNLP